MFTEAPEAANAGAKAGPNRLVHRRTLAQALARFGEHLSDSDRALIRAYFDEGRSASEIARLARSTPKTVLRRIDRIAARISSPGFVFVLNHRKAFVATRARIATACIIHGLSMRAAARQLRLSVYLVRTHLQAVQGMIDRLT